MIRIPWNRENVRERAVKLDPRVAAPAQEIEAMIAAKLKSKSALSPPPPAK